MATGRVRVNVGDEATTGDLVVDGVLYVDGVTRSSIANSEAAGRELLRVRAISTGVADGAGINLYGDGDSTNPDKIFFYSGGDETMTVHGDNVGIGTTTPTSPLQVVGNIAVSGTVDGVDISGIEAGATADQTAAEIRSLVGSASDSNVFTDADHSKLDGIASSANNYSHPTHPSDDFSLDSGALSGAVVVSDIDINVTTDGAGHVTDANGSVGTRTLTLANLGYTGATDANNYSHPTYAGDDFSLDSETLSGATVISDIDINISTDSTGHVTDTNGTVSTRTLTLGNLGYTGATDANNYSHPTGPGNEHIPPDGNPGEFLKYASSGTATWAADNNTTYSVGDGGLTQKNFTTTLKTKLDGIAAGAEVNVIPTTITLAAAGTSGNKNILMAEAASGNEEPRTDAELYYEAANNRLVSGSILANGGNLTIAAANPNLVFDDTDNTHHWRFYQAGSYLYMQYSSNSGSSYATTVKLTDTQELWTTNVVSSGHMYPASDDTYDSGVAALSGYLAWDEVRAHTAFTNVSDANFKTISGAAPGLAFLKQLNPVSYSWTGKTRQHWGFTAQEVEAAITAAGMDPDDCGVYCDAAVNGGMSASEISDEANTDNLPRYALRYNELIAPLVQAVTELAARVEALEGA